MIDFVTENKGVAEVGGTHYEDRKIQPIEYIHANNLNFDEGNVVKYITRHRDKNGIEDLKKCLHYVLFEMEKFGLPSELTKHIMNEIKDV